MTMPFMQQALALAAGQLGQTWPNPSVGCLIVKDGQVIGQGVTQKGGRPHAEAVALQQAGALARGADVYVTLEPCAHHGQTPPCATALIKAGVARVVVACGDPDPRVAGRGIAMLREAGIAVEEGVMAAEAQDLNRGFFKRIQTGKPWVTVKIATSLDGRIALANGQSQWLTGEAARAAGHALRASHDAILVGIGTVLADDPQLTCRLPGLEERNPLRIVLDSAGRLPATCRLLQTAAQAPVHVFTGPDVHLPSAAGLTVHTAQRAENGLAIPHILETLGAMGLTRLLVEGGGQVITSFLQAEEVDEIHWFQAPVLMGNDARPAVGSLAITQIPHLHSWRVAERQVLGQDALTVLRK